MNLSKSNKQILSLTLVYILALVFISTLYSFGSLNSWQEKITDRFFTKYSPKQNIVILSIDDESINKIGSWPWKREVFANVLGKIKGAKAIGIDISFSEPSRYGISDDQVLATAIELASRDTKIVLPVQLAAREKVSSEPEDIFKKGAELGMVNMKEDSDSIVRNAQSNDQNFPSFSLALSESTAPQVFRIAYAGPERTFLTIPIIDSVDGVVPQSVFQNAVVLIGATASDLHDTLNTPFGAMSGVEVHANTLETILDKNFREPLSPYLSVTIFALLNLLCVLCIVKIRRFRILILCLLVLLVGVPILGAALFSYEIIFPTLYATLGFILTSGIILIYQFIHESKEKKFIRETFQYYLMPDIINELLSNPEKLKLGGERKKLTIMFTDIVGFTNISETMTPEELTHLMNEYLGVMTEVVMKHKGLVDKYIGDAVMAFWGAPLPNNEQESDACKCAIEMSEKIKELNERWQKNGLPTLAVRVGINTGEVVVGNMGSQKRFNYTVIGDEVNFASRLEGINNYYGTNCIVSENVVSNLKKDEFILRELDTIRVKGKNEPKKIFELVTQPNEQTKKKIGVFETGLKSYRNRDWASAKRTFEESLSFDNDKAAKVFLDRMNDLGNTPPSDWNGIFDFKSK